ncbi:MAG: cell division protein FtsQ/DivIB [Candidatus Limnocylindrales bacterium]
MSLPVRPVGGPAGGRRRGPARASAARRSADRVAAVVVLVAALVALGGLCVSPAFALGSAGVKVVGARYVDAATVTAALGLDGPDRPNLMTLRTVDLEAALRKLPAVDPARADAVAVRVALPDRLVITLHEREPIVIWQAGGRRFLVDQMGMLFAEAPAGGDAPGLPSVVDGRASGAELGVGQQLDATDIAAVRRLAALTPAFLGSAATGLTLAVTDDEGFTLDALPAGWHAVFGIYTPSLRPPSLVDGQAQCLASLIATREATLGTVYLAPGGERCGTFTTRPASSAKPSPTP